MNRPPNSPAARAGAPATPRPRGTRPARLALPNGLVVIFHENHANPTVAIQGLVRAGAILDPPRKSGLSCFVASMLDRGTAIRTAYEQAEALESLGASLHFDSGPETVTFSGNALSEDLGTVLEVLGDALRRPVFAKDQIENHTANNTPTVTLDDKNLIDVNPILFDAGFFQ